ncbi:MAG TPA: threonine synthase [Gaiellaceae bacterium]|nr:threonine synthase [Gaiellaceae bacterium]
MTVETLRCRMCGTDHPAVANGICSRCFGPLEPIYDWEAVAHAATRERIEAGPRSLWRYAPLLPAEPPEDAAAGPGWTPLVPAPRLAAQLGLGEVHLKLDLSNPTHSFKDRVVAVAAAKAAEFGLETLSATSTGNLANAVAARAAATGMRAVIFCPAGLEAEKLQATTVYGATVYGVRGSYDDCSRLVSELAGEVEWGIVNVNLRAYYAEGSKTLAYEIAEQLGWELPDAVVMPIGSGAMYTKVWKGFQQFRQLELVAGTLPKLFGGQAAGCNPVAAAFAEDRRVTPVRPQSLVSSIAIGDPADGDLASAIARESGGAMYTVPEDEVGANISLLAETSGIFGEGATGVAVGALREAARRGELGAGDRVVVLVTGTGLKTPGVVQVSGSVVEIEPDVDALLAELGVAA